MNIKQEEYENLQKDIILNIKKIIIPNIKEKELNDLMLYYFNNKSNLIMTIYENIINSKLEYKNLDKDALYNLIDKILYNSFKEMIKDKKVELDKLKKESEIKENNLINDMLKDLARWGKVYGYNYVKENSQSILSNYNFHKEEVKKAHDKAYNKFINKYAVEIKKRKRSKKFKTTRTLC